MSYLPITKDSGNHDVVGNPDLELREQDRWLPIANVARLMKSTLPPTAKVSKDAKECMQECVSEFISFITSEASDKCLREKRKTINGEDVLYSLHDLGFENYAEVLKIYLAKYREQQAMRQEKGDQKSSRKVAKKQATPEINEESDNVVSHDSQKVEAHNIPYSEPSPRKDLHSPDFFQQYDEGQHGGNNELGSSPSANQDLKHDLDMSENLQMNDKDHYQYGDFIETEEPSKDELKEEGIDHLSKLEGGESDMDNLGMESRNYF